VESVRQTVIASQVSGQVVALTVKAGDAVRAGQLLARIDARAAEQSQAASAAQLAAARAQLTAAERNLDRTRQLVAQKFLSASTLDRAEADHRAAAETVKALRAQTAGAATQTGWHTLVAPFDAIVSSVSTELGDTALPGKTLMHLQDPSALRVAVNVPAGVAARLDTSAGAEVEIPDAPEQARRPQVSRITLVAAADPVSHTQLVRLDLPRGAADLTPGLFARVRLPLTAARDPAAGAGRVAVPLAAVVSRGDLRAVYVAGEGGSYLLRQVRLGRTHGDEVEVLSGLAEGERVALDPIAAARVAGLVGAAGASK
jgi:RND family efflux transporter MFP subunit